VVFRAAVILACFGKMAIKAKSKTAVQAVTSTFNDSIQTCESTVSWLLTLCPQSIDASISTPDHRLTVNIFFQHHTSPELQACFSKACLYMYNMIHLDYGTHKKLETMHTMTFDPKMSIYCIAMASYVWIVEQELRRGQTSISKIKIPDETPFIRKTVFREEGEQPGFNDDNICTGRKTLVSILVSECLAAYRGYRSPFDMVGSVIQAQKISQNIGPMDSIVRKRAPLSHQTQQKRQTDQ
jgi:hypothetical protein